MRAANTGISAIVDPLGRIVNSLPLGEEGVIDGPLPRPIAPSLYAKTGDGLIGLVLGAVFIAVLRVRSRRGSAR